jgi:protein involved in polysaccharide export with SLBB domain
LIANVSVGCAIQATATGSRPTRPAWLSDLQQDVETLPPEDVAPHTNGVVAPDRTFVTADATRGVPRDLTRPFQTPATSPPAARPTRTGGGAASKGSAGTSGARASRASTDSPQQDASSTLERLYTGRFSQSPDRKLDQFGYGYFDQIPAVSDSGPVPEAYLIGPDDEIIVTVWGSMQAFHRLTVERDGRISIPEVGSVAVAGKSFGELESLVRRALGDTRKNFELSVSLGKLRKIQIHVVGNVARPGLTEVSARATILDALMAAGGPQKNGSLRKILHRRGESAATVDLYDFLVHGDAGSDAIVLAGDVIMVPPVGTTVGVAGYVQRPAIYETQGDVSVDEALELAGGLTPFTFTPTAQLERTRDGRGRMTIDLSLDDEGRSTRMQDGELLLVGAVDTRMQPVVRISGQVIRPGSYEHRAGMRISDLLQRADGPTIDAYLPQVLVSRQIGPAGELEVAPNRSSVNSARRVLVIDLGQALEGNLQHDIELMALDHVTVRGRYEASVRPTIEVIGPVRQPGTYELTAGLRVSDLIALARNLRSDVYYDEGELIRRTFDEERRLLDARRFRINLAQAIAGNQDHNPLLMNGDQLVVRALRDARVTVQIMGEVRFPGTYVFPAGATITDLIAAAGGVLDSADLRAAVFTRESVRELQQKRFDDLMEQTRQRFEQAMTRIVQTGQQREGLASSISLDQTRDLLSRMSQSQVRGRVVVPFTREDFDSSAFNLVLESGDKLQVPQTQETVSVLGHVFNPATFVAEPGMTVKDLIDRSGGLNEYGDSKRTYVIRADGNVDALWKRGKKNGLRTELHAGDVVLVPKEPLERTFGAKFADALKMARQVSEVAALLANVNNGADIVTVLPSAQRTNVDDYKEAVADE